MTALFYIALLFGGVVPDSATSWMDPARFGLATGMTRAAAAETLAHRGHKTQPGKEPEHLLVHLDEKRSVTLAFEGDVLRSIRFELVGFTPEIRTAFREAKSALAEKHGKPSRVIETPPVLQYDAIAPRIYVVAAVDRSTDFGKRGLGFLVIRYFDAPPER